VSGDVSCVRSSMHSSCGVTFVLMGMLAKREWTRSSFMVLLSAESQVTIIPNQGEVPPKREALRSKEDEKLGSLDSGGIRRHARLPNVWNLT
jgi:hypothetical protein